MEQARKFILQNLIFGLLALLPIVTTFYVFIAVLNFSDNFLFNLLPPQYRPDQLFGRKIPGLGICLTFIIILFSGILTRNFFGKRVFSFFTGIIDRIPVARTLYTTIRQFLESIFMDRSDAFRKVVIIEYPKNGLFTLAFVTSVTKNESHDASEYEELYSVFVPTTPNPTSGFFLLVSDKDTYDVEISVHEAFRLIVSGGVLTGATKADLYRRILNSVGPYIRQRHKVPRSNSSI